MPRNASKLSRSVLSSTLTRKISVQVSSFFIPQCSVVTGLSTEYASEQANIIEKVTQARTLLPEVEVPMEIRLKISQVRKLAAQHTMWLKLETGLCRTWCRRTTRWSGHYTCISCCGRVSVSIFFEFKASWDSFFSQGCKNCHRRGCLLRYFPLPQTPTQKGSHGHYWRRIASLRGLFFRVWLRSRIDGRLRRANKTIF